MLTLILMLSLVGAAVSVSPASQEKPPNFSGTWDIDLDASKALTEKNGGDWRVSGAGVGGPPASTPGAPAPRVLRLLTMIKQTATEFILERGVDGQITSREVYKLDGSESVNARRNMSSTTRTVWKGSSLVTTGSSHMDLENARNAKGEPITAIDRTFVTTRTLRPDGTMVVESHVTQDGKDTATWSVLTRVK